MLHRLAISAFGFPTALSALVVAGSYLGALHPLGDSLAVFRPHATLALGLCALALIPLRAWRAALLALALALVAGLPILAAALPAPAPDGTLRVYAKNILFGRGDTPALLADIRDSDPDILLIQELSATRGILLDALADSHPQRHICQFSPLLRHRHPVALAAVRAALLGAPDPGRGPRGQPRGPGLGDLDPFPVALSL